MTKKERFKLVLGFFASKETKPVTELHYNNPFELLVSVVLSAQCTDKRVNMHTPLLFRDFPTPFDLAQTDIDTLFPYIKSISFPNNKTKNLIELGKVLVSDFHSEVPSKVEDLIKIPGVGRKTANVIASVIFNQPTLAVDTHVFRVSKRLGLVDASLKTPREVEDALMKYIPLDQVADAHHWLILHGRYICTARSPQCEICPLNSFCLYRQMQLTGKTMDIVPINKGKKAKKNPD